MTGARLSHARRDLTHRRHRAAHERQGTRLSHKTAVAWAKASPRHLRPMVEHGVCRLDPPDFSKPLARHAAAAKRQVYDRAYRMPLRSGPRLGTPLASPSGYKLAVIHTVKQTYIYFRSAQRAGGGLTDETPQPTTDSTALHSKVYSTGGRGCHRAPVSGLARGPSRLSCTRRGPGRAA